MCWNRKHCSYVTCSAGQQHSVTLEVKIKMHPITCDPDSNMRIRNVCEKSLLYDSVFRIFLVACYAQWFPVENHVTFFIKTSLWHRNIYWSGIPICSSSVAYLFGICQQLRFNIHIRLICGHLIIELNLVLIPNGLQLFSLMNSPRSRRHTPPPPAAKL